MKVLKWGEQIVKLCKWVEFVGIALDLSVGLVVALVLVLVLFARLKFVVKLSLSRVRILIRLRKICKIKFSCNSASIQSKLSTIYY